MKKLSILYIVLAGVLWGTSPIFVNSFKPYGFTSMELAAIRNIVSAAAIFLFVLIKDRKLLKAKPKEILLFILSGIFLYTTCATYYMAIQLTSPATAVVLMYIAPMVVMIVSVLFLGEKFTCLKGAAVAAVILGCGLVTGIIGGMKFSLVGILYGIAAGLSYSGYNICTKIEMRRGNNATTATVYCFLAAGLAAFICANPVSFIGAVKVNMPQMLPLGLSLGLCTGILPYFLYTLSLKRLPVGTAAAMSSIEPLSATIFSVVLYNEVLGFQGMIGVLLILASVIMLSRGE